jgi:hypothetical protein
MERKRTHGQFPHNLEELVDKEHSYRWSKFGDIKGETPPLPPYAFMAWCSGSTTVAAEDQALSTDYFKEQILTDEVETKCQRNNRVSQPWPIGQT